MKTLVKFLAVLLLVSCGMSKNDRIKKEIESKKNKIVKLEEAISKLQKELTDTTEAQTAIAVTIKNMKPEVFNHYITVFGNVEADQFAKVSPEMNGQIDKIYVEEGQSVNKGDLLVSLNSDATQSSLQEARTAFDLANTTYKKQKDLWDQGIGSEIQFLTAKTQKETAEARVKMLEAQIRMAQVRAPFNGIVDRIYLKEGDIAGPMTPVVEFVNLSELTIKADVSETYIEDVKAGEKVSVKFSTLPDIDIRTPIVRTSKVINAASRTFQIELHLNNRGEKIMPNMISTIRINDFTSNNAFVVPSIIIRRDITGDYLYVVKNKDGKQIATKAYVTRGLSNEGSTMITNGLTEGDKVIIEGYSLVSSGSLIAVRKNSPKKSI